MPIWPVIPPLLRFAAANVDIRALYALLARSRSSRLPCSRAHTVEALNARSSKERANWTPQSLFLFIAGFVKVEAGPEGALGVEWIREPATVVDYILRGRSGADDANVRDLLLDECRDVGQTLVAIAPHARPADVSVASQEPEGEPKVESGGVPALRDKFYAGTAGRIGEQRRALRDRRIAALLGDALLRGGLSTNECRQLLLAHGIPAREVDAALRSPQRQPGS